MTRYGLRRIADDLLDLLNIRFGSTPAGSWPPNERPLSARPSPSPPDREGRQSTPAAVILRMRAGRRLWGHGLNIPQPWGTAALPPPAEEAGRHFLSIPSVPPASPMALGRGARRVQFSPLTA
jgi:hypothetical protein